jgi:hypothetical protein
MKIKKNTVKDFHAVKYMQEMRDKISKDTTDLSKEWDPISQPSGVYFYKLNAGKYNEIRKMIYTRKHK